MSGNADRRWWGPIFEAERVIRARRWQEYTVRSVFVAPLLMGLLLTWAAQPYRDGPMSLAELARVGAAFFDGLSWLMLLGVLFLAPAATAGAICLDKSRGMLTHIFVTDLSDREIILGKLAARLPPVWGLIAATLPVVALATWFGGIDPVALTGVFLIAVSLAWLGCAFALLLSVWASRLHEVLAVVYGVWVVWLLAGPASQVLYLLFAPTPVWIWFTHPFYLVYELSRHPGSTSLAGSVWFCVGSGLIGLTCVLIAVAWVRAVGCRSVVAASRRIGRIERRLAWLRGNSRPFWEPKLDANPVLWREWHRDRPSRWSRVVWTGYGVISTAAAIGLILRFLVESRSGPGLVVQAGLILGLLTTLGLLLLSTGTAAVLAEERARGSLDVLLCTPLATRSILWAK